MWNLKSLFNKHAQEIQRFLQKRGHGPDVAADLTQDVFLRILGSATPKRDDNPRAYLHMVARSLSVDLYRREKVASVDYLSEEAYCELPDESPNPERVTSDRQQLAVINHGLTMLPEQTRRAFELYRLGDMTIAEVAQELDLSVSHTWTLIRRAYQHLRTTLDDDAKH